MRAKLSFLSLVSILFTTAILGLSPTVFGQQENGPRPLSFISANAESYVFDLAWGGLGSLNDEFSSPEGVAVDRNGNVWVADKNNHRVLKFDSNGNFLFTFGGNGTGDGQFSSPHGITIDNKNNVWVADTGNNRVQKFTSTGKFLGFTGGLSSPHGIAAHPTQNLVYVANTGANAMARISTSTLLINLVWGSTGSGNSQFNSPHDVAVDRSGRVYVADFNNNRIQRFSGSGAFQLQWGVGGFGDGRFSGPQFNGPSGVEVDACGDVFVVDDNNHRIQKFTNDGTFITMFGWNGSANGQFTNPVGVAVDSKGRVFVADTNNHRIQRFSPSKDDLTYLFKNLFGTQGSLDSQFQSPQDVEVNSSSGDVYVADTNNNRIQKFNASGTFITKWGSGGSSNGLFNSPTDVALDGAGNVYVADANNHRIEKFDASGTFLTSFGLGFGTANGQFSSPNGVAVNKTTGVIWVADTSNHRIQKFNSAGAFLLGIGNGIIWTSADTPPSPATGNVNSSFSSPIRVAVDSNGDIYVSDTNNQRIQKFQDNGVFVTRWGIGGAGNGQFSNPWGVAVDGSHNVYVVDRFNYRIQKFDSTGRFITKWGSFGNVFANPPAGGGLFNQPLGIAVNGNSDFIYVADWQNHRIQRFERFGFSLAVTPASNTITQGNVATYTLKLNGVGPNTMDNDVAFCLLSGTPNATVVKFTPASVKPSNAGGEVTSTLTLDTSPTTAAKTYILFIEATGGGQTRVKSVLLKVNKPPPPIAQ